MFLSTTGIGAQQLTLSNRQSILNWTMLRSTATMLYLLQYFWEFSSLFCFSLWCAVILYKEVRAFILSPLVKHRLSKLIKLCLHWVYNSPSVCIGNMRPSFFYYTPNLVNAYEHTWTSSCLLNRFIILEIIRISVFPITTKSTWRVLSVSRGCSPLHETWFRPLLF